VAKIAKIKCFNCGEKRDIAKSFTHSAENGDTCEPPMAGMTMDYCHAKSGSKKLHEFYEVRLT
jgi:hypothetical protein